MNSPNFSALMDPAQLGASVSNAFQMGLDRRRETETNQALADYAQNQSPDSARNVSRYDPRLGIQLQDREDQRLKEQQAAAQQQAIQHAEQFSKLATWVESQPDKASAYEQAIQAAHNAGMDVQGAPPNYDPAWVQQNLVYAQAFLAKPAEMTMLMQNVAASGYKPGTPEFEQVMRAQMDPTKTIPLTEGGGLATYTPGQGAQMVIAPNPGGFQAGAQVQAQQPAPQTQPRFTQVLTPEQFAQVFAYVPGNGAAEAAAKAGAVVRVSNPQEAAGLPPGTWVQLPDGSYRQTAGAR